MHIAFNLDGSQGEFYRGEVTGRAELRFHDGVVVVQSPYSFSAHFAFRREQVWRCRVENHEVQIVKRRLGFAAAGPFRFTISVNDEIVAEDCGK